MWQKLLLGAAVGYLIGRHQKDLSKAAEDGGDALIKLLHKIVEKDITGPLKKFNDDLVNLAKQAMEAMDNVQAAADEPVKKEKKKAKDKKKTPAKGKGKDKKTKKKKATK